MGASFMECGAAAREQNHRQVLESRLEHIGVKLTKKQADRLGVPIEGPYKPENYRY